jgi:hypothetical protein
VSCLFDSRTDDFYEFVEGQVPALLEHIQQLDRVVGFNIKRFDYRVLSAYTRLDFSQIPTLDILEKVKDQLGYRLSLDHLASVTLNAGKTADGLDALRWWREGKMAKILEYCRSDVAITRDLYRVRPETPIPALSEQGQADSPIAGRLVTVPQNGRYLRYASSLVAAEYVQYASLLGIRKP